MRQIDAEELKKIQLQILDVVAEYCDRKKIGYWLDSGTLIGAVRHNGYIPWDDDIDIGMLREDFDRFFSEFNLENSRYAAYTVDNNPSFTYAYGKVLDTETLLYEPDENGNRISINIDVFVYDNVPDSEKEARRMFKKRDFYRRCNAIRTQTNNPEGNAFRKLGIRVLRLILNRFPDNYFALRESENAKRYKDRPAGKVGNFVGYKAFSCEKSTFDSLTEHEFEGKMYKIPGGYDQWLTACYGDYMRLPPEQQRVSHHMFKAFVKENEQNRSGQNVV